MSKHLGPALALVALTALHVAAGEGKIPLWQPTTITEPGHYIVTRDIESADQSPIVIQTGGVTLDLGGKTAALIGGAALDVIRIDTAGAPGSVVIRNGRIEGGRHGVHVESALPELRLAWLEIALSGGNGVHVSLSAATASADPSNVEILSSHITDSAGGGVMLADPRPSPLCLLVIADSMFGGIGGDGIETSDCDLAATDNTIEGFGQDGNPAAGIVVSGTTADVTPVIEGNLIAGGGTQSVGVLAISPATPAMDLHIADNVITDNGAEGILVQGGQGRIADNTITENGGDGVRVDQGQRLLVEDNYLGNNKGVGLHLANNGSHAYRGNFLRGNVGGAFGGEPNTDAGGNIP